MTIQIIQSERIYLQKIEYDSDTSACYVHTVHFHKQGGTKDRVVLIWVMTGPSMRHSVGFQINIWCTSRSRDYTGRNWWCWSETQATLHRSLISANTHEQRKPKSKTIHLPIMSHEQYSSFLQFAFDRWFSDLFSPCSQFNVLNILLFFLDFNKA